MLIPLMTLALALGPMPQDKPATPPPAPQTFPLAGQMIRGYQNLQRNLARGGREDAGGELLVQADARDPPVRPAGGARRAQPVRKLRRR